MPQDALAKFKEMAETDPTWKFKSASDGALTTLLCATASLDTLRCHPPLKDHESQVQYYRDVARASKLSKLVNNASKVDELIQNSEDYCKHSKTSKL
jgi:hypothetical protein